MSAPSTGETKLAVIITAAGSGSRFGGQKLAEKLGDDSVLSHAIKAFVHLPQVTEIIVALSPDLVLDSPLGREVGLLSLRFPRARFCPIGGASRCHTVASALRELKGETDFVAIHDGARPLVSRSLIDRVFAAAIEYGAAAPAIAVTSTIKQAGERLPSKVERTVPRSTLWAMQTPQIVRRDWLVEAVERCPLAMDQVTDDVQLLELAGKPVMLVDGDERNLKITTPIDLVVANAVAVPSPSGRGSRRGRDSKHEAE